ncbi:MAG: SRPBCC family protein [Panacagrimonas sp.]
MRVLKGMIFAVLFLVGAFLVLGFFLPDQARVERSVQISASQQEVFDTLNGFERFNEWSPWAELDPNAKFTRSGPQTGVGARFEWRSDNASVGAGSQQIVISEPPERIQTELFFDGYGAPSQAQFVLSDQAGLTTVRWIYETDFQGNFLNRYFGLMLDSMLGPQYERGLENLKQLLEQDPEA